MKLTFKTNFFKNIEQSVRHLQGEESETPKKPSFDIPKMVEEAKVEYTIHTTEKERFQALKNTDPLQFYNNDLEDLPKPFESKPVYPIYTIPAEPVEEIISPQPKEDILTHLPPTYEIFVGDTQVTKQYGILGTTTDSGQKIAMDLNGTNTISLFGVQGAGKSYSIGTITEMVLKSFGNINYLPNPLAGVIFHYSESEDYKPEFTSMIHSNNKANEINKLRQLFDAYPDAIKDLVLLVPKDKILQRRQEYPNIPIVPISFASSELGIKEWKFLMGATNNTALYMKQFNNLMRSIREDITLQSLEKAIEQTKLLSPAQKELARMRLSLAKEFINDDYELKSLIKPGRLLLVDLRDEFIEKDDALSLFVIMMNIFAASKLPGQGFNKFIVFDEAHKYMANKNLTQVIVETIREMRHKGVSLMIASQDPPSLPSEIIELSSMLIAHRFNSPQWLKHIQKSVVHLSNLSPEDMANLKQGEAYFWANKSNDHRFTHQAVKINTRPRVTLHGGATITAQDKH